MLDEKLQSLINNRKNSLQNLVISTADNGLKYLFAMNGGAIIAVLAFIGSTNDETSVDVLLLPISLLLFFLAILLVGFVNLRRFHLFNKMLWRITKNERELLSISEQWDNNKSEKNEIDAQFDKSLKKAIQEDEALIQKSESLKWLAYVSFILFGFGGLITSCAFL